MVTEAPAAVKARTNLRADGSVPGQVSLDFDKYTPEQVLEIAGATKEGGFNLELATRIQGVLGQLPDDLKLHTLAFWNPKTRGSFIRSLADQQAYYLRLAESSRQGMGKTAAVNEIQLARLEGQEHDDYLREVERAKEAEEQEIADLTRVGTAPIVLDDIQEPPAAWVEFMGSLTFAERSLVGQTIARRIYPGHYFEEPETFARTLGDFRREHEVETVELEGRVLGDPSSNRRARKKGLVRQAFLAVATRRTNPQA